jgi:hypothetical protein
VLNGLGGATVNKHLDLPPAAAALGEAQCGAGLSIPTFYILMQAGREAG